MLASVRRIPQEERRLRAGHWQGSVGMQVYGRTLGIVGLGGIGSNVARNPTSSVCIWFWVIERAAS